MPDEDDPTLDLEVATATQTASRLSQERTQHFLRVVAVATAMVLVLLSTATLVYVVHASQQATDAAREATVAARGNARLLAEFQRDEREDDAAEAVRERLAEERFAEALTLIRERADETDQRRTEQLQRVLDLLVEEVRSEQPRSERTARPRVEPRSDSQGRPRRTAAPSPRPGASPRPTSSRPPPPPPAPRPTSSRPSCATGPPILGICLPPP